MEFDLKKVQTLINNQDKDILIKEKCGKSDIWQQVKAIFYKNEMLKFVLCNSCNKVLPYNTKTGISNIKRHTENTLCATKANNQTAISSFLQKKVSPETKTKLNKRAVLCIAMDIRPFTVLQGEGFKLLAQELINIGAQYGKVSIEDLFYSRRTLSTTVLTDVYEKLKQEVTEEIKLNLKNGISFTTDFWTDEFKQISYLSLTAHTIDDNFNLKPYLLHTINYQQQKTGDNIRTFIFELLQQFFEFSDVEFIEWKTKAQFCFVTDNGSNIVSALKNEQRISCAGHNLNLVLEYMFKRLPDDHEITKLVAACKSLVGYFKRSGLNNQLKTSVKQSVVTRWNSVLTMLKSVKVAYDEIVTILTKQNDTKRMKDVSNFLLDEVILLLEPFEKATNDLSSDRTPSITFVLPWFVKLNNHLEECKKKWKNDCNLKEAVTLLQTALANKYIMKDLHQVATLLDPRMKTLKGLCSDTEKERLQGVIIQELNNVTSEEENTNNYDDPVSSQTKKQKLDSDIADLFDCTPSTGEQSTAENELYTYSYLNSPKVLPSQNILQFWKESSVAYPRLAQYAKSILCIPATSTSSERNFSLAGKTLDKRRSTLKPHNVDKLLFIGYNTKNRLNSF